MKKNGKTISKALVLLAMGALLVGTTAGYTVPSYVTYTSTTPGAGTGTGSGTGTGTGAEGVTTGQDTDIMLNGVNAPAATYGTGTTISFTAKVKGEGYITSISPVVTDTFPFESNDAAYQVVEGNSTTKELAANYWFTVRTDVASGYQAVGFNIEYVKDGQALTVVKTINVKFEGAPAPTEAPAPSTEAAAVSTPRVIVTGYETDVEKVYAGQTFKLTLHLQNTSKRTAVSNMKVSLTTANGEFLPVSGSSTEFVSSLGSGKTTDMEIEMSALATLDPKPYVLTVTCNYEDGAANPFEATENISIPVYQEARIKITDVTVSPDTISVGDQGSISFSINNLGKSTLANVQVKVEGDSVDCEESFVGNIAAGATGYADVTVTGVQETTDDGTLKLIITYEDSSGEECTYEDEVTAYVTEMSYDDNTDDYPMDEPTTGLPVIAKILIAVGVLVVIAVIVVVIVIVVNKNKKKKAAAEAEELEDELDEDLLSSDSDKENVE